ncbi:MAG: amino acid adenylation domain-containing protein, partial [Gemmatimonadetes bacterium]|nr:amino acid adenylation domain-containing protein [Gemmatimonadota bacterium]
IPRREVFSPVPLSMAQQRLWVLDQLEPGSAAYNMPMGVRLRGVLDLAALRRTMDALVARHEALRTTFAMVDGEPMQVVGEPAPVDMPLLDLSNLDAGERDARVLRMVQEEAGLPFDLTRGPLLRLTLLRLGEEEHVALFTMHHIVSDGWSMQVLVREVSALYSAFARGETPALPELEVQYPDFAAWQHTPERQEVLEAQIEYWKTQLSDAPPLLEIPTDRPRASAQGREAGSRAFALSEETSERLRKLSRGEGATLFMTLLAGWQTLLGRYAATDDISVGMPVAGRTRRETQDLIGFFVNTLVLRSDLSGEPTVRELVGRVRETVLQAQSNQDVPFDRLVDVLRIPREQTHSPLFQVMFSLVEGHGAAESQKLQLPGLALEFLQAESRTATFDLSLVMGEQGGGISGEIEFRTALFDAETIERISGHFQRVLGWMVENADRPLSDLALLDTAEREQVLVEWNPARELRTGTPVHQLISAQAIRTADAVALVCGADSLSYAELERRSNQLAHALIRRGVGPEVRVGVCTDRSAELVVAVLGILKAGGAYVPLDPMYPAERLAFTLEDSGASVLLTQSPLASLFANASVDVVRLDEAREAIAAESMDTPAVQVGPEHLAYVIYTSGSTGLPKGVRVEHRHLMATLQAAQPAFAFGPGDEMPSLASYAFDIWLFEALLPLLHGAAVRLVPSEQVVDVPALVKELRSATLLHAVPALMRQIVEEAASSGTELSLRQVFVGGDAVAPDLLERMQAAWPQTRVWVLYGPTEGTIICAAHEVEPGEQIRGQLIGQALGNTRLYVCDARGALVPVGVPGELCLGGASVARDYLGREELTAEKFVADPFSAEPGARMYRTGDRARWLTDGTLEFLGRIDQQVKIRGFRIEPGEVESLLRAHPAVQDGMILVREDTPGERRLVAYVVPVEGPDALTPAELRNALRARLPEYMVPSAFVMLEALPLTPNGKVDRRALPAPEGRAGTEAAYVAPRTSTEATLAQIWGEVLGVERVGVEDNFFEIGGHSLLAVRIGSRLQEAFATELPLRTLFEAPTVAALAERVDAALRDGSGAVQPIPRRAVFSPVPLSMAQQRLWVLDQLEPGNAAYNMPMGVRLRGVLDLAALQRTMDELVARHEALRTTFAMVEGEPMQVVGEPAPVEMPLLDLSNLGTEERDAWVLRMVQEEAGVPFDLTRGPLLRLTLLRLGEEEHVALFTMHHIVSDGWSMQVLVREVSALYSAFARGETPSLPELGVQYPDFAAWQHTPERREVLEAQTEYWKTQLSDVPPLLEIPTDRSRASAQGREAGNRAFDLSPELSEALRALSRGEGATLFMTLLAGWQTLLGRYAATEDVSVGMPVAGRTRRETQELIGFFVNTLVLRSDLSGEPTVRKLVGRVRETVLQAQSNQDVPFDRLVDVLRIPRERTHSPLFQVMFSLVEGQGSAESPKLQLPGLTLEFLQAESKTAKFDLSLVMGEQGGGLGGGIEYRTALFDEETIERLSGHFQRVLGWMVENADRPLSELSLLDAAERNQVLEERNPAEVHVPESSLHALFQEQARRTPDTVALVHGSASLTYAELDRASSQLARHLRGLEVGPETRVGVCLERTPELVVALLGILRAGGAYVPLDPAYPAERLAYMVKDAGARVVVTQDRLASRFPEADVTLVRLDADRERIESASDEAPAVGVEPENLSHVIFTSGST